MNYHLYLLTHMQVEVDWLRRARSIISVNPWQRTLLDNWFRTRGNSLVSLSKWEVLPEKDWEDRFVEWVVSTWWPNARPKAKAKPGIAANSAVPETGEDSSYDSYTSYDEYDYYSDEYSSSKSPPLRDQKMPNSGPRVPSSAKGKQKGKGKPRRSRSGRRPRTGAGQAEDASEQSRGRGPGGRGQGFRGRGKGGGGRGKKAAQVAQGDALLQQWRREMKEDERQQQTQPTAADEKPDVAMPEAGEASVQTKAETGSADVDMQPSQDELAAETAVSPAPAAEPAVSAVAEAAVHAAPAAPAAPAAETAVSAAAPAAETAVPAPPTAGTAAVRRFKKCRHLNCSEEATSRCRWRRCGTHCRIMLQDSDEQCRVHT